MSSKKLNPFKDFQSDKIQRTSRKIFTAHYPCRNATLNLTPVTGTTKGFIFQIINSLIESWGVHLTWFDCNWWSIEWTIQFIISYNPNYEMLADFQHYPRLCSKKNLREPSALKLWNPGRPTNDCMKKLRFCGHPGAKVRCQGPSGSARARPFYLNTVYHK